MSKASVPFELLENELLQDDEVRAEYENLKPRYEIVSQMIKIRNEQGIMEPGSSGNETTNPPSSLSSMISIR